jgi:hypothetical protein
MPKTPEEILADPCTSYWLKNALASALERDCVDASHDAELLAHVLSERAQDIVASRWPAQVPKERPQNNSGIAPKSIPGWETAPGI